MIKNRETYNKGILMSLVCILTIGNILIIYYKFVNWKSINFNIIFMISSTIFILFYIANTFDTSERWDDESCSGCNVPVNNRPIVISIKFKVKHSSMWSTNDFWSNIWGSTINY